MKIGVSSDHNRVDEFGELIATFVVIPLNLVGAAGFPIARSEYVDMGR